MGDIDALNHGGVVHERHWMDFVHAVVGIGDFKFQLIAGDSELGIGGERDPERVRRRTST